MFCSNCGKTVDAGQDLCPHCGEKIGQSKMGGHTSVQSKYEPVENASQAGSRYTPYTKTTYTSNVSAGDDVYSRTAYRPVIVDINRKSAENVDEPVEEAKAAEPDDTKTPADLGTVNLESLEKLESVPDDAPDSEQAKAILEKELNFKVKPVTPIKKTGISPEVESYIKRVEAMKNRSRKKRPADDEEAADKQTQETFEAQDIPATDDDAADEPEEPKKAPKKKRAVRTGKPKIWLSRVLVIALIAILIGGGVIYLAFMTQPKDQIPGVDNELFKTGVELIKSHTTSTYRSGIAKAFSSDTTGAAAVKMQAQASEEIKALMPQKPKENDGKFIDTLLSIQEAIDAATTTDALAILTKGDTSLGSLSDDSQEQWGIINNYVTRLENAKDLSELSIVSTGVADVMATPEPSPTPSPSAYKTLKKGDTNSKPVKQLQVRLFELGWFTGNRDGDYGTITVRAVKLFQQAAGMETTGIATPEVQEAIFAEDAVRTEANATPAPDDSVASGQDDSTQAAVLQ